MEGKPLKDLFSFDISPYAQWQVYPSGGVIFPPWEALTQLVYLVLSLIHISEPTRRS